MYNNYNSNMYLTYNQLNDIENEIEDITNEIQEKLYNNNNSPLRTLQVGDNLNGKMLYLNFPRNLYEYINTYDSLLSTDNNSKIKFTYYGSGYSVKQLYIYYYNTYLHRYMFYDENKGLGLPLYKYDSRNSKTPVLINSIRIKLPNDFGTITEIDTTNPIYNYIKIYDDEDIIPNYNKNVWNQNDVPSMQKIENIERGIRNIGYYSYKPNGWQNEIEWLETTKFRDESENSGCINSKNISYKDLNRWDNDLNIIDLSDDVLNNLTIWNTEYSELNWDEESDIEWEDL